MSKFTPGPWTVEYDNSDERSGGQWFMVGPAKVWFGYQSSKEDEDQARANAHLISAAPDLLRLVKAFESYLSSDKFEDGLPPGAPLIDDVIAVIAKAEGKQ